MRYGNLRNLRNIRGRGLAYTGQNCAIIASMDARSGPMAGAGPGHQSWSFIDYWIEGQAIDNLGAGVG